MGQQLMGMFLVGVFLLHYPILSLFVLEVWVFDLPLLYLYLFVVWLGLIACSGWVVERKRRNRTLQG